MPMTERRLGSAILRGIRGRCPACGQGRLLQGYITPVDRCLACGEDLSPYRTADLAPYLVTFMVGIIFTPLALKLTASGIFGRGGLPLMLTGAVALAAIALPRAKGAAIALLWALNVRA